MNPQRYLAGNQRDLSQPLPPPVLSGEAVLPTSTSVPQQIAQTNMVRSSEVPPQSLRQEIQSFTSSEVPTSSQVAGVRNSFTQRLLPIQELSNSESVPALDTALVPSSSTLAASSQRRLSSQSIPVLTRKLGSVQPKVDEAPAEIIREVNNLNIHHGANNQGEVPSSELNADLDGVFEMVQRHQFPRPSVLIPAEQIEQSTWLSESNDAAINISQNNDVIDPNKTIPFIASGKSIENIDLPYLPGQTVFPNMFTELTARLRSQEREELLRRELNELSMNQGTSNQFDQQQMNSRVIPNSMGTLWESSETGQQGGTSSSSTVQAFQQMNQTEYCNLATDILINMDNTELKNVTDAYFESNVRTKFKATYPFLAEGMIQRDSQSDPKMLHVYSSRLGHIRIPDTRADTKDYVYFMVINPGEYGGFRFFGHPNCIISAKLPAPNKISIKGRGMLVHPIGREDQTSERSWFIWNDSLGLMDVISGSARIALKKYTCWDKQLDIVIFQASFEDRKFRVDQITVITEMNTKRSTFPEDAFLVDDAVFKQTGTADVTFHSQSIKADIVIKKALLGSFEVSKASNFEMVVAPTFPHSTQLEFRGMLLIDVPSRFWSREKIWIRDILSTRTDAWR